MKNNLNALVEKKGKKMLAIATDETIDRHGDSLNLTEWDFKNFKKNPVLQFAHDYGTPPIGIAKNLKREEGRITFEPEFHEYTQLAREIKKLYEEGIMKAFSVGFIQHFADETGKALEKNKSRLELLEISAVPIPANPNAVILEKSLKEKINKDEKSAIDEWINKSIETKEHEEIETSEIIEEEVETAVEEPEEEKAGKVLSKKSRSAIESALKAFDEAKKALETLLEVDKKEEVENEVKPVEVEEKPEEKTEGDTEKAVSPLNDLNQGRYQELILKETLEAIKAQTSFIARKIAKK